MSHYFVLMITTGLIVLIAMLGWLAFYKTGAPATNISLLAACAGIHPRLAHVRILIWKRTQAPSRSAESALKTSERSSAQTRR